MKKIAILCFIFVLTVCSLEAKDYAKMQIKEMKHAQKYGTTQKVLQNKMPNIVNKTTNASYTLKDPKIMKFGDYEIIPKTKYDAKLKKDEAKYQIYAKQLSKKHSKYYTTQADAEDYYRVYRVAERLIRANKLDYLNWRICIYKNTEIPNAYTNSVNYVAISTSLYDTFKNNDDALALIIGHEMGHALLGHSRRSSQLLSRMQRMGDSASKGSAASALVYLGMKKKYIVDSKNMEYAADVEGAKLALHAGYNLNDASDVLTFFSTYDLDSDMRSDHPNSAKRLQNFNENKRYFPEEWQDMGKYNIYNSEVLPVELSSDRKSIVISAPQNKLDPDKYYSPETMEEVYARFGYMYYVNREFEKSVKYFGELFKLDQTNATAYLYASYASECLYNSTNNSKYMELAKEYAQKAYNLDSKNKYIKEQFNNL